MEKTALRRRTALTFKRVALGLLLSLSAVIVPSFAPRAALADDPPTVTLTSPAPNAIIHYGQILRAAVGDDIGIMKVQFGACFGTLCAWNGIAMIGTDTEGPPYEVNWTNQPMDGTYTLLARVTDSGGQTTVSAPVTVTIDNDADPPDLTAPIVSIFSPPDGSRINEEVMLNAGATDNVGVTQVDFRYCGGSSCEWNAGTTIPPCPDCEPYSVPWQDQPPNGAYTVLARAADAAGNATVSDPVSITISNRPADSSPPTGPTLTLSEATANQHRIGTTLFYRTAPGHAGSFTVRAATSDPETGIAHVSFPPVFGADGANVAPPTAFARTYSWSVPAGAAVPPASGARGVTVENGAGIQAEAFFTVTPDVGKPTVSIVQPLANATIRNGAPVRANATDAGAGVASVAFKYCPGTRCSWTASNAAALGPVAGDTLAPYRVVWTNQPADDTYTLIARAVDRVGNAAISRPVRITIANGGTAARVGAETAVVREALSIVPLTRIADERAVRRVRARSRSVRSFGRATGGCRR